MSETASSIKSKLEYWLGLEVCVCHGPHPIGGCLKCDLQSVVGFLSKTTMSEIADELAEWYGEGMLQMDGFDKAILGVVSRCGQQPFLLYDQEKVVEILREDSDMTYEDAVEYMEFNQKGAWMGEGTPGFLESRQDVDSE